MEKDTSGKLFLHSTLFMLLTFYASYEAETKGIFFLIPKKNLPVSFLNV